jgi:hypothetical protein
VTLPMTAFKFFAPQLVASRDATTGQLRLEGIASSTVRDHHGDTISEKALRKMAATAEAGMVIFMNHSYEVPKDVFGTCEKSMVRKTAERDAAGNSIFDFRIGVVVAQSNAEAVKTFELIEKDKVKLGISIGAMLPEGGYTLDKSEGGRLLIDDIDLIEASIVSIPANPRAWVDYAVKSIFGAYPTLIDDKTKLYSRENPRFSAKRASFLDQLEKGGTMPEADPDEEQESEGTGEVMTGIEVPADGTMTTLTVGDEVDDGSGLPEVADGESTVIERTLQPGEKLAEATDVVQALEAAGATAVPIPEPGHDHLELGDELDVEAHDPDVHKAKAPKMHQHPHAHSHDHEHEHGYDDSKTVHAHGHAHQHSHDHGADHEHDDTQNDYSHNHPHSGSWNNEDHAHGDGAVKADPEPTLQKTVVPDKLASTVTVWESEDGTITEVNTGRKRAKAGENQSVQDSLEPETTGGSSGAEASSEVITASAEPEPDPDPVDEAILSTLKALAAKTEHDAGSTVKALSAALTASREQVVHLRQERDTVVAVAKAAISGTQEILIRVGKLPAGRKTLEYSEIKDTFSDLSDIYDSGIRKAFTQSKRS